MKRALALVLLLAITILLFPSVLKIVDVKAEENSWTTSAPMLSPRAGFDAAVVDGRIYVVGGTSRVTEEYDPSADTWATKAFVPTDRSGLVAVTVQDKVYAIGGYSDEYPSASLAINEVYDPTTNSWATKAEMPTDRGQMCANSVNGQIYITGGLKVVGPASAEPCNETEAYNPITDTWTTKTEMPYAAFDHSSVVIGDKIYVFPSDNPSNDAKFPIQIYDTKADSWSLGSFPPTVQSNADAVTILDERGRELIYIIGGGGYGTYLDLVQIYDPQNDVWGVGDPMPTPRYGLGAVVVNNQIYALGGVAYDDVGGSIFGASLSTNERYNPLESGSLLPTPTSSPELTPIPTPTEEPQQPEQDMIVDALLAVASIVVFLSLLFYFIKRK
jgi:N-acetylneuraminic acid mutarotase